MNPFEIIWHGFEKQVKDIECFSRLIRIHDELYLEIGNDAADATENDGKIQEEFSLI